MRVSRRSDRLEVAAIHCRFILPGSSAPYLEASHGCPFITAEGGSILNSPPWHKQYNCGGWRTTNPGPEKANRRPSPSEPGKAGRGLQEEGKGSTQGQARPQAPRHSNRNDDRKGACRWMPHMDVHSGSHNTTTMGRAQRVQ